VIPDSACPLQVTDRAIIAGHVILHITFPAIGSVSPPASPVALATLRGFLW